MAGLGDVELLTAGEPAMRVPPLRTDLGGVFVSGVAQVDGAVLRDALLQAAGRYGLQRLGGAAALTTTAGRVTGARLDSRAVPADVVVLAAGAWSAPLCAPLGVRLPVAPERGLTVHLQLTSTDTSDWPSVRGENNAYLVAFPNGRVVAGASIEPRSGYEPRITPNALHQVLRAALVLAPGLGQAAVIATPVGLRPVTPDGLPLLGPVAGLDGLVIATGLGSQGLTYGPLLGARAADLALGRPVDLPLEDYQPDRTASDSS